MHVCLQDSTSSNPKIPPLPPQFDVTNTLNDQLLEDVRVEMEQAEGFTLVTYVPIPKLAYGQPATTYSLMKMDNPGVGNMQNVAIWTE